MKSGSSHGPTLSHCLLLSKSTEASFSSNGRFPLSCLGNSAALPGSLFTGPLRSTWSRTLHSNRGLHWIKEHRDYRGPYQFTHFFFFFFFAVGFLSSAPTLPSPVWTLFSSLKTWKTVVQSVKRRALTGIQIFLTSSLWGFPSWLRW